MAVVERLSGNLPGLEVEFTQNGRELLEERPELDEVIEASIRIELETLDGNSPLTFVGSGGRARVNNLLGEPGLCIKTTGPKMGKLAWKAGRDQKPEDLILQLHFMDALGAYLARGTDDHNI